jgi:hypothetical protein
VHHGDEDMDLWRTDGSPAETEKLHNFAGEHFPDFDHVKVAPSMYVVGEKLYFSAHDGEHGIELWSLTAPLPPQDKFNFLPLVAHQ